MIKEVEVYVGGGVLLSFVVGQPPRRVHLNTITPDADPFMEDLDDRAIGKIETYSWEERAPEVSIFDVHGKIIQCYEGWGIRIVYENREEEIKKIESHCEQLKNF